MSASQPPSRRRKKLWIILTILVVLGLVCTGVPLALVVGWRIHVQIEAENEINKVKNDNPIAVDNWTDISGLQNQVILLTGRVVEVLTPYQIILADMNSNGAVTCYFDDPGSSASVSAKSVIKVKGYVKTMRVPGAIWGHVETEVLIHCQIPP